MNEQQPPDSEPVRQGIEIEVAKFNLSLAIEWIKFADAKATFLMTVALAVLGTSLADIPAATEILQDWWNAGHWFKWLTLVGVHVSFYGVLISGVVQLLVAVWPRLAPPSDRHSWFFFQSMGMLSAEDFHAYCKTLTPETILHQLCDQVYNNQKVARNKYKAVSRATIWLFSAIPIGMLAVIPVMIVKALK